MIDSLVSTYKCPECWEAANENNVDIIGAAWSTINIDIHCTGCDKHAMIKSEVVAIDVNQADITPDKIALLKGVLESIQSKKDTKALDQKNAIKDEVIVSMHKDLKEENISISDLLDSADNSEEK